jgi:hypothetical protein
VKQHYNKTKFPFSLLLSLRIVVRSTVRSNWYFIFHLRCFFYSECGLWYCFVYLALYVPLWLCLSARIVFCCTLSSYWNFIFRLRCFLFYSDCGLLYCYVLMAWKGNYRYGGTVQLTTI